MSWVPRRLLRAAVPLGLGLGLGSPLSRAAARGAALRTLGTAAAAGAGERAGVGDCAVRIGCASAFWGDTAASGNPGAVCAPRSPGGASFCPRAPGRKSWKGGAGSPPQRRREGDARRGLGTPGGLAPLGCASLCRASQPRRDLSRSRGGVAGRLLGSAPRAEGPPSSPRPATAGRALPARAVSPPPSELSAFLVCGSSAGLGGRVTS